MGNIQRPASLDRLNKLRDPEEELLRKLHQEVLYLRQVHREKYRKT
jgi:hypothetical protein